MKRRRAEESADGLALMTSSMKSSYSADGLREQSQESAAIAKRCRLHKLIRQRFALALKIQQEDFALFVQQSQATEEPVATQRFPDAVFEQPDASNSSIQSRAYMYQLLLYISSRVTVQARRRKTHVYVVSHTVAAVVQLRSLGVLTAAGCGIGSVHAVVRSNLLVEPSEVEEGEM
ncbi:hypothetical protein F511_30460 [Dorcoceras hygrometricum]|uniref:Uncharacterized protein n=1 Tax=Dorcoceras hygrometricum TaxID=472368 RepID=A0A2Z7BTB8_9LAMI|nr:hypothetical protein F511_30460 [Dorcoceras hygrometricum]